MDAPGVRYFEVQAGGQTIRLFRCEVHHADLTPTACAARFRDAKNPFRDDFSRCRYCPIGAAHAGKPAEVKPPSDCVRCGKWAPKLVRGLLCVPCYNRQLEVLRGKDRRGRSPHTHIYLWGRETRREPQAIPAVFPVIVRVDGKTLSITAATFREALLTADRLVCHGRPMPLEVLNAAEIGRQAPRHRFERAA